MRKFLLLLCALLGSVGTWADVTVTLADASVDPYGYGTRSNSNRTFTSNDASGLAGVVLDVTGAVDHYSTGTYAGRLALKTSAASTDETWTLTAPEGYVIKGYSFSARFASSNTATITAGGNAYNIASSDYTDVAVSGLKVKSTSFTVNASAANWIAVGPFTVTLAKIDFVSLTFDKPGSATDNITVNVKDADGDAIPGVTASLESTSCTEFKTGSATALSRATNSVLAPNAGYANAQGSTITYTFKVVGLPTAFLYNRAALDVYALSGGGSSQSNTGNTVREWTFDVETGAATDALTSFVSQEGNDICTVEDVDGDLYHKLWTMSASDKAATDALYIKVTLTKTASLGCFAGIGEVQLFRSQDINVTYELYESDGTTLVNTVIVEQQPNSEVSIPAALTSSYFTTVTEGTIGEEACTIKVIRTVNEGIVYPITNLSNSKSYYIKTRNNARGALSTYTNGEITYLASPVKAALGVEAKKFAIISYEDNYYLYSVEDEKFVTYSASEQAPLAATVTGTSDRITFSATTNPLYELSFDGSTSKIINSSASYAYGLVFNTWGASSSQWDDGCQYTIEEADDFDATDALAALEEFFHPTNCYDRVEAEVLPYLMDGENPSPTIGKPFGLTTAAATAIVQTYMTQLNNQQFTLEEYEAIVAAKNDGILYPADGYYYLKNASTGKYLRAKSLGNRNGVVADVDDPATVPAAVIEVRTVNEKPYMISNTGWLNWVYPSSGYEAMASVGLDKYAHWLAGAPGQGAFGIALGNGEGNYAGYLATAYYTSQGDDNGTILGGVGTAGAAQWIFEEATSITISLNAIDGVSYATTYLPFGVTLDDAAEAYVMTKYTDKDGDWLIPASIGQNIPAGTPVLIKSATAATSVIATIDNSIPAIDSANNLEGAYFSAAHENDVYVLNAKNGEVGFYTLDGTLAANRAYLPKTNEVKGFRIKWDDTDAISSVEAKDAKNATIFNLAGQRVNAAQKGVFIVNGKKVVLK